jgi:hypothetical protein
MEDLPTYYEVARVRAVATETAPNCQDQDGPFPGRNSTLPGPEKRTGDRPKSGSTLHTSGPGFAEPRAVKFEGVQRGSEGINRDLPRPCPGVRRAERTYVSSGLSRSLQVQATSVLWELARNQTRPSSGGSLGASETKGGQEAEEDYGDYGRSGGPHFLHFGWPELVAIPSGEKKKKKKKKKLADYDEICREVRR